MEVTKKVGVWIRVSTEDQAKGDSPEHHEKRAKLYAESKGWEVVKTYHLEALSGKSVMAYPETKRMLEDIRKGQISGIIFSKLARLARNTKELLEFADIFKEYDADLISLQEAIDTSTPAGRLFYTMIAAMAQWEREEIVERITASIPIRAKLGKRLGGYAPYGYSWEGNELVIDEQQAPIRKLVFELFLKFKRKKTVARVLNEQGYRGRGGRLFTDTTINTLLRDPVAKGQHRVNYSKGKGKGLKPESDWVIRPCPAIVSEEIWNECNRLLDESLKKHKRKGPRAKHLLAGYITCQDCEKTMYVFHSTKTPTYKCKGCGRRIAVSDIDEIYHEQLKTFLLTDVSVSEYMHGIDSVLSEKQQLLERTQAEIQELEKEMSGLTRMRARDEMTKDVFAKQYKPMEERYLQLVDHLPALEAEIDILRIQHSSSEVVLHDAKNLYTKWHTLPYDDKRTIVEVITDGISIGKEDIHIKLAYLPHQAPPSPQNSGNRQSNY